VRQRRWSTFVAVVATIVGLTSASAHAGQPGTATPGITSPVTPTPSPTTAPPNPAALASPATTLPKGWKTSKDRAVSVEGDANGLHLLVADEASGYTWRTAATLADNAYDADSWIGQACVTGSGNRAVVVYAPRTFTNSAEGFDDGGFVAIVDLRDDSVRKLDLHVSLGYFNPGCGTGETVAVSTLNANTSTVTTTIDLINAATGAVTAAPTVAGEVTSAVPSGKKVVAALGTNLITVTTAGVVRAASAEKDVPFRLHPDAGGGVGYEVTVGKNTQVRRFAGGTSKLLGSAPSGGVQLTQTAGHVYLLGPDRAQITTTGLSGWSTVNAPVNAAMSTTGTLAVTGTTRLSDAKPVVDQAQPVTINRPQRRHQTDLPGHGRRGRMGRRPGRTRSIDGDPTGELER